METDQNDITYRILSLTLEIICHLTGESFPPVRSGDNLTIRIPSLHSLKSERDNEKKILEVIQKMIGVLTGEVPIRCQDVTVYFSMEEWEYLEGHKDLYKDVMMEDLYTLPAPDVSALGKDVGEELAWREDEDLSDVHNLEDSISSEEGIFTDTENDTSRDCAQYTCRVTMEGSTSCDEGIRPQEDVSPPSPDKQTSSGQVRSELLPEPALPRLDTLRPTENAQLTSSDNETEPNLYKDLAIDNVAPTDRRSYTTTHIKEEPLSDEEDHFPESGVLLPMDCSSTRKDEPESWDEGDFLNTGLYTHHGQYISAHIKMESGSNVRKRWPCFECGKTLSTRSNLFVHQRSHVRKKPFMCNECGKGFSSRGYLVIHRRNHTGERPFACSECGESYTAKSQLLRHQTKLHSNKRFVCADCGRGFIVRSALNEHHKIHSGEKPFSCAECGRCFNRKSNLISHYKVHTGEKPYGCPDCSKSFTTKSVLRAHQRIHMGLKFRS